MYTDTFSAFAFKVLAAVKGMPDSNRTKYLQGKQVRFKGSPVSKSIRDQVNIVILLGSRILRLPGGSGEHSDSIEWTR